MNASQYWPQLVGLDPVQNCSSKIHNVIKIIVNFYYSTCTVFAILNIIANSYSLHIFRQPIWRKSTMSLLLKGLSLFEVAFHLNVLLDAVFRQLSNGDQLTYSSAVSIHIVRKLVQILMLTFQMARNWTVVMLAAYRYEAICRSMSETKLFRDDRRASHRVNCILCVLFLMALCIAVPRGFEEGVLFCPVTWHLTEKVAIYAENFYYSYIYIGVVMFAAQSGGPVIIVCVLSAFVIRVIWKRKQFRKNQKNSSDRPPPSGDKLVMVLCVTFFIFETPAFFSKILNNYLTSRKLMLTNIFLGLAGNLFIYADSMINVFIYMGSNPHFRQATRIELGRFGITLKCLEPKRKQTQDGQTLLLNESNNVRRATDVAATDCTTAMTLITVEDTDGKAVVQHADQNDLNSSCNS